MAERHITEEHVRMIVAAGVRTPELGDPGAPTRWRYGGRLEGRFLTVIVADDEDAMVVITVY
jgi:hypothetical protein